MSYQGHAGQGGLQNHSVGGCYPFAVFGRGDPTAYGVLNAATGEESAAAFTCAGAWELAEAAKHGTFAGRLSDFNACLRFLALREWSCGLAPNVPDVCCVIDDGSDQ